MVDLVSLQSMVMLSDNNKVVQLKSKEAGDYLCIKTNGDVPVGDRGNRLEFFRNYDGAYLELNLQRKFASA